MANSEHHPTLGQRAQPRDDMQTRQASLLAGRGGPASLDEAERSVEVVAASEQPVAVFDPQRWEVVDEVLLMEGLEGAPEQVPLLDAHFRGSTSAILGSARGFRVEGPRLLARAVLAETPGGEQAWALVRGGHLTDVSVGYQVNSSQWVEPGRAVTIAGRQFQGPLKVVTSWSIRELSLCPIGADEAAKVRAANPHHPDKERTMDPRLRAYLEKRGLAKEASKEEALRFLAELERREGAVNIETLDDAGNPAPAPDPSRAATPEPPTPPAPTPPAGGQAPATPEEAARSAERARVGEIMDMCRAHGIGEEDLRRLVDSGQGVDQCGRQVLALLAQRSGLAGGGGHRPPARIEHDERDKFRAASGDSLLVRGGVAVEKPASGHAELMGYSLRELARDALRRAGQRAGNDPREWVGRALTTSDLPNILMDVANKAIMFGWESAPETWPHWCATGQVSDFKPAHEVRLGEFDDLDQLTDEEPEYKYGSLKDAQETYQIATYGKGFRISRRAIIDDDLGLLVTVPMAMGEAASRTVGDVAWASLIANGAMGDGKALFHADHANILEIDAFDVEGLGQALMQMTAQMDLRKKRHIRVQPTFFLSPTALFVTAEKFFGSDVIGTAAEPNIKNPFTGTFSQTNRIYEPRLDDHGASTFYLAGPKGRTVKVFFLNGVQAPFMDAENDWNSDGRKFKVRIDVGSKAMDWRGLQRTTIG